MFIPNETNTRYQVDKFIEAILKIVPFRAWLERLGLGKELSAGLSFLLMAGILWLLISGVKKLFKELKNKKAARDLKPQFDYQTVQRATAIYIPTQYQNASPARQEEPGFTHQYMARDPLIPFFIETAFNEKADNERFYLILADSGMGKTTFMLNLYLRYHAPFNRHRKHKMRLFRFSHPDTLAEIKAIKPEEARNTILLLDALDEDPNIVSKDPAVSDAQAFQRRVDEIIETTRNFCEIVLTCRTQYFPGQEDNPYELNVKRPDEKGFYTLNKIYLSPFTDREVRQYLRKKYGWLPFLNHRKKERAAQIVQRSRLLVMRPMLLSYIDYLVEDDSKIQVAMVDRYLVKYGPPPDDSLYGIYQTLIEKWLLREGEKRRRSAERPAFIASLRQVSQQTAITIYLHWLEEQRLYLTKEEAVAIAARHGIELRPEEVTGQSLLTCDGLGNWKFAHKSILEFFLAKVVLENPATLKTFNFTGINMARQFLIEKNTLPLLLPIQGGEFLMGSPSEEPERGDDETQHAVQVGDFYMSAHTVTLGQFELFVQATNYQTDADKGGGSDYWNGKKWVQKAGVNWRCDVRGEPQKDKRHPAIHVSRNDAVAYCDWLSTLIGAPCRLPTEAEWEYACRAGTVTPFYTGEYLSTAQANYDGNYPYNSNTKGKYLARTAPVGSYPPNPWGLFDMHGNVWEWCADWYDEKYYETCKAKGVVKNSLGPSEGLRRVLRGGGWGGGGRRCRAAYRYRYDPAYRGVALGFRLVSSLQGGG